VKVVLFMPPMPTMNMPAARSEATLVATGGGLYRGTAEVMIPGRWTVTVNVARAGKPLGARQFAVVAK
jgi:YtkA-like